jgi:outer membrane PBP1 activator LpoA protein
MQRLASWFLSVAALYVSLCGSAIAAEPPPSGEEPPAPHIALLLPLQSDVFGKAAQAVQQGFMAAANAQPHNLPVRIYASFDEPKDIIAMYQHALSQGAKAVVGPLTRNGVAALAAHPDLISVPTLALNVAEGPAPAHLYYFGLNTEDEARQVAQIAAAAKLSSANIISTDTPLSRRLAQAFAAEWVRNGGSIASNTVYNNDPTVFATLPTTPGNMVFLAADPARARLIRPYVSIDLPVYATSQVFAGNSNTLVNFDLNDIHFIDMPWLLQPDHPAVMIYPRPDPPLEPDLERLYALGIDAFRLVQIMLANSEPATLPLDGVTGNIHLNANHQFVREAIQAQFKQGRGLTPEQAAALAAQMRAAAAAAAASGVPATPAPASQPAAAAVQSKPARP